MKIELQFDLNMNMLMIMNNGGELMVIKIGSLMSKD